MYLLLPAQIESVVSFRGSFLSIPDFASGDALLRDLTVSMFDKGSESHSKFEMAELLEDRGAQVSMSSDGVLIRVSGRALRDDVPLVLRLVGEQLREPALETEEFIKVKERFTAALRRSLVDTGSISDGALSRRLFREEHPNFIQRAEDELERLAEITVGDICDYYKRNRRLEDWRLVLVGDIEWAEVESEVPEAFGLATPVLDHFSVPIALGEKDPGRESIFVADRDNIDVRFGHVLPVTRLDEAYLPLYIAAFILGGNFSARLMAVIRDQLGLTYGIHAGLSGFAPEYHGMWGVSLTLSRENLDRGIEATLDQINRFVDSGITENELEEKTTTIAGSYKVGLSTTGALADTLLRNAERGRNVEFLDRYPDWVRSVALEDVNEAIGRFFQPDALHITMAGSIDQ